MASTNPEHGILVPSQYATLSFHKADSIRLLSFPDEIKSHVESLIVSTWPPGIQSTGPCGEAYEFKLKGKPWGYFGSQDAVGGIRLLRDILALLYDCSWELVTSAICSRRYTAKDTLIFRQNSHSSSTLPAQPVEWLGLATAFYDKIRIVYDAKPVRRSGVEADHDHLGVIIMNLKKMLESLDYFEKGDWSHDSFEFKLKGRPWRSRGEATIKMRLMVLKLLETMESMGWRVYTTILQRTGTDEDRMTDTWYFVRTRPSGREVMSSSLSA
ncbi:hypothetical protein B0T21DRAFT_291396 [Apiosordaria backusii]|uniref:Uncharacterized protein n=1 Tax=Apiosordaria backusii TaxID=314023 RepID=A0AA40BER9_9PEZI|nr:hypothetical protein B0T21DRAFT_291396 [Apiosordaria backusii]